MGYVMSEQEIDDPDLNIEIRRESVIFSDAYYPWDERLRSKELHHVFAYGGGQVEFGGVKMSDSSSFEVSKVWLAKFLKFFDNAENRAKVLQ